MISTVDPSSGVSQAINYCVLFVSAVFGTAMTIQVANMLAVIAVFGTAMTIQVANMLALIAVFGTAMTIQVAIMLALIAVHNNKWPTCNHNSNIIILNEALRKPAISKHLMLLR